MAMDKQIKANLDQANQVLRRKQYPSKHAPILNPDEKITLSGCVFFVYKQDKNKLILRADGEINFYNGVDIMRAGSYLNATRSIISIAGWDWRPSGFKKGRLTLKPYCPSSI